jgi:thioredoxin-like negative regulator of GroEL
MALFSESTSCERRLLVAQAQRARRAGRRRRAIALYQRGLALEPDDIEVALALAPLLAWEGRHFEAWSLFRQAGKALLRGGRLEWCLAVFKDATRCLPFEFEAWRICAELEQKLRRPEDARETLLEGRQHFRSPALRGQAVALLKLARSLDPWHPDIVIDLAQLTAQNEQEEDALDLLRHLALRCSARDIRRVRAAQLRMTWSVRFAVLWWNALWHELRDTRRQPSQPLPGPSVFEESFLG